jgi:hypothetical protein
MRRLRTWSAAVVLVLAGSASAQTAALVESPRAKECVRVELMTRLDGQRIFGQEGEQKSQKTALSAQHRYTEKTLAVHSSNGLPTKAARHYDSAQKALTIEGSIVTDSVRPQRRLAVAQRANDGLVVYSPAGPLTREELETLSEHFDTLSVTGVLPGKEVAVNDTWKLSNDAAQGLCAFEGLVSHELTGRLVKVQGDQATISVSGVAKGIDVGAQVVLTVNATGTFDLSKKRLVALEWKQDDVRDQGPASPAFKATVVINVKREPVAEPKELTDGALESVPAGLDVPAALTALTYREPRGRFELNYARDWRLTGATDRQTTLRLMERGDFVAQATITPWEKAAAGQHMKEADFRTAMLSSPGWEPGDVVQEGAVPSAKPGWFVYRLVAQGTMNEIKVVQTFFLVANAEGEQAVVAFTTREQQLGKLGARDLQLVEGLEFGKK